MGVGNGAERKLGCAGLGDAAASKTRGAEHESASNFYGKDSSRKLASLKRGGAVDL